jgi:CDP-diacylglycerol---serine O-phosphatidyltransferase
MKDTMTDTPAPIREPSKRRLRFLPKLPRRRDGRSFAPFELKKALFILPNAFNVASILCGFYAITLASAETPESFYRAGSALIFAAFFDTFDGRIARLTKTQSDFGMQMDSLADVMSFGLAPAVLVYHWGLSNLGTSGIVVSGLYASCGAIRLARFNVLAARKQGDPRYFVGLPIPAASTALISVIMAQSKDIGTDVVQTSAVLTLVLVLSYLMVSRVGFRTFKDFKPQARNIPIVVIIFGGLAVLVASYRWWNALVVAIFCYLLFGLSEDIYRYVRRPKGPSQPPEPTA